MLIHGQAIGEVNDLILCLMNDQHGRCDFRDLSVLGDLLYKEVCHELLHFESKGQDRIVRQRVDMSSRDRQLRGLVLQAELHANSACLSLKQLTQGHSDPAVV